jgi:TatA/E family protein of Tat protein translocase
MFGVSMPELLIVAVIALIVIGPSKLPEIAKAIGKGLAEFRKATQEIKDSLDLDHELKEVKKDIADSLAGLDKAAKAYMQPDTVPKPPTEEKKPKYGDFDEMLEDYEGKKTSSGGQETETEPSVKVKETKVDGEQNQQ